MDTKKLHFIKTVAKKLHFIKTVVFKLHYLKSVAKKLLNYTMFIKRYNIMYNGELPRIIAQLNLRCLVASNHYRYFRTEAQLKRIFPIYNYIYYNIIYYNIIYSMNILKVILKVS